MPSLIQCGIRKLGKTPTKYQEAVNKLISGRAFEDYPRTNQRKIINRLHQSRKERLSNPDKTELWDHCMMHQKLLAHTTI